MIRLEELTGEGNIVKFCPVCQMGNSDDRVVCKECNTSLGAVAVQDEDMILKAESDRYERWDERRKRNYRILKIAVVMLSTLLHISLFVVSIIRGNFSIWSLLLLFMPVADYIMIVKAEELFEIEVVAFNDIDFMGKARPS